MPELAILLLEFVVRRVGGLTMSLELLDAFCRRTHR